MNEFIRDVEIYLIDNRVSKIELCKLANISYNSLWQVFNGVKPPSARFLLSIEKATGGAVKANLDLLRENFKPKKEKQDENM